MKFIKKIDRARQWAGEKMGGEARTAHSEEFKMLEAEMSLRSEGINNLQKSMNIYTRWLGRRCDALEDRNRNTPAKVFGQTMATHGEDFEQDSEFGNCLVTMGQANERIAELQGGYLDYANVVWVEHLERNGAMMKDYQSSRKRLESRRLAYDATIAKMQKSKQDDFRVEEELRSNRAKFDDASEDVLRRMQDIKDSESDSVAGLTSLLDAQLDYHERAVAELRRVRQSWAEHSSDFPPAQEERHTSRSRSNTARSWQAPRQSMVLEEPGAILAPVPRHRIRSNSGQDDISAPIKPPRPTIGRAATIDPVISRPQSRSFRATPLTLTRTVTDSGHYGGRNDRNDDVFADDSSVDSGGRSPDAGYRSVSPATSYSSVGRSTSALIIKKGPPPPPPVNRAKKPPPPPAPRKPSLGY